MIRVVAVLAGAPQTVGTPGAPDPMDRAFTSAIWKTPVAGPVFAGALGLEGDAVANTKVHGGVDQALLMYAVTHYPIWESELGHPMSPGAFGENIAVEGMDEDSACVGDVLEIGSARFEVTQPRQPCATLARRHQVRDMIALVRRNGRSGWYLRVLKEGAVEAGQEVRLVDHPNPDWTIRRAARAMLGRAQDRDQAAALSRARGLSEDWRRRLSPDPERG